MAQKLRRSVPIPAIGLDVSKPGEWIDYRATTDCQNIEIRRALIQKRPGSTDLGDTLGERIQSIFDYDDGQATHFFRIGNTLAEKYNQTTDAWASVLAAPLNGSDVDRVDYAFPVLAGSRIAVFTNGIDPIMKNTGAGDCAVLGGSPPVCRFLLDYSSYLVLAYIFEGGNTRFTRVQWCNTGDVESWAPGAGSDAGSVELLDDSDDISGLGGFGQYITVHKRSSIYVGYLTGTSAVFRFDRKSTGAGTVANDTIRTLPTGEQAFLATDGIRTFNGLSAPTIDAPIMDELREFMNPLYAPRACSKIVKELDEYWVGVPIGSQTEPETIYKFNYLSRQVYKDRRPLLVAMGDYQNTTSAGSDWDSDPDAWDTDTSRWDDSSDLARNLISAFGFSDGTVRKKDTSLNDETMAIESFWDSKDFTSEDFGLPAGLMMRWQEIPFYAKGQSVGLQYSIDAGSSWLDIGTYALTSDYPVDGLAPIGYFETIAKRCRFRFRNFNVDEGFSLKQFNPTAIQQGFF